MPSNWSLWRNASLLIMSGIYTPPEVEALGGKKARRCKQSLIHFGKPLGDYDLCWPQQFSVS